ncbi:hypothetical protein [Streptomyces sp. A5-4]|uniref:hypothetical protein n=1 Tax=Streptomyces sp. A5-4 TaxID=3384771 RepID=UPI003DA874B9
MFLIINAVLSVWAWRLRQLPGWRRRLPAALLACALAANVTRATGITAIAETAAFPLHLLAALTALNALTRARRLRRSTGNEAVA